MTVTWSRPDPPVCFLLPDLPRGKVQLLEFTDIPMHLRQSQSREQTFITGARLRNYCHNQAEGCTNKGRTCRAALRGTQFSYTIEITSQYNEEQNREPGNRLHGGRGAASWLPPAHSRRIAEAGGAAPPWWRDSTHRPPGGRERASRGRMAQITAHMQ